MRRASRGSRWAVWAVALILCACGGSDRGPGVIEGEARPAEQLARAARLQATARAEIHDRAEGPESAKQILFGDLHVHTTYSIDAFARSLPILAGEGAHPPADACDFARYCSQLDFFSLNDHAEGLTPEHWRDTLESLRQCNARAGDPSDPDLVAFAGWEWTQVGITPETHYGHKNVIFPGLEDDELPARPISSASPDLQQQLFSGLDSVRLARWIDPLGWREYSDFAWLLDRLQRTEFCEEGLDTRELPPDCHEAAPTPAALFEKLGQWGFDALVIPHGTSWGLYTPPGVSMDKQLTRRQHDPELQSLVEIHSGHGNSEDYRAWRPFEVDAEGRAYCPEPSADFLPCCWQAGEIMRGRCDGLPDAECEARVEEARQLVMRAGVVPNLVFPDTRPEDWLDCDQCRDCFKPAMSLRPRESVQYAMAISNFDELEADGDPLRFRWGFIASSDNHTARPGTGYKQYARTRMTEASGARSAFYEARIRERRGVAQEDPQRPQPVDPGRLGLNTVDFERQASFFYPGGLVAAHVKGRGRHEIWSSLARREVYGTSGPRILLWFDLLNGPRGPAPMGSDIRAVATPRFEVRAVGAFVQQEGCPEPGESGLSPQRLERLCRGECYRPGERRHPIVAIEVVRIRPQAEPGEPVDGLIEDPWLRFDCDPDPAGCVVRFEDPELLESGRDALYYVRALQEETPAVNGDQLRTRFDDEGRALSVEPCFGSYRTAAEDDCLAPVQERAWSSPIFLDLPADGAAESP